MEQRTILKRAQDRLTKVIFSHSREISEMLSEHAFLIQQLQERVVELENAKKYLADVAAHHAYLIEQVDKTVAKEKDNACQLGLKIKFLLENDPKAKPKVVQLVQDLRCGDAIGNYILAINNLLIENGFISEVYAESIDSRIQRPEIKKINELPVMNRNDLLILHIASENRFLEMLEAFFCKIVICYHNITPAIYFENYNETLAQSLNKGRKQLRQALRFVDYCIADSDYNKQDLMEMGFEGEIKIIPPILRLKQNTDIRKCRNRDEDNCVILSVGRIVPNKKIEDIIEIFEFYKKFYNDKSRLILVGSYDSNDAYYQSLMRMIEEHQIPDVIFTGHVSDEEVCNFFAASDVYLCMSEHEGVCVPLVEAMQFHLPVIAAGGSAVPETMGQAGIILPDREPKTAADTINRVMTDIAYRNNIVEGEKKRLEYFEKDRLQGDILGFISTILGG